MRENVFEDRALQKYLNEISKFPTLTREEEIELVKRAKAHDKTATDQLIRSNLKFVVKIAAKYQNRGLSLAELISEGNIGLIKAIEKFDADKENKLISYAIWWIKYYITFALGEKVPLIRIPISKSSAANKLKAFKDRSLSETGKEATMKDISDKVDMSEKQINKLTQSISEVISLDDIINNNGDSTELRNIIEDVSIEDPKTLYYKEKLQNRIEDSINNLEPRDAFIVKSYFGLEGRQSKNFAQIGDELGLSRERIRQIQAEAIKKILKDSYQEFENDIDVIIRNN